MERTSLEGNRGSMYAFHEIHDSVITELSVAGTELLHRESDAK
jgi:hypothetical protein